MTPLRLKQPPGMTDEQYFQFCQLNRDFRIERNQQGDLIIMPPTGMETGDKNSEINFQLRLWNRQTKLGKVFDSSTGFTLPNAQNRSPDASWVSMEKWQTIPPSQRRKFGQFCPDFVVELRSPSDNLDTLKNKMREYLDNGAMLGWLLDPDHRRVYIYRPGKAIEELDNPENLSGNPVLPGFILELAEIW